jgi:hypothetical protein
MSSKRAWNENVMRSDFTTHKKKVSLGLTLFVEWVVELIGIEPTTS